MLAISRGMLLVAGLMTILHPRIYPEQRAQMQQLQHQLDQMHATEANNQQGGPWTTSYWDLGQNITMVEMENHIEANDAAIAKVADAVVALGREQSDLAARSSVWFEIIGGLVVGSLGLSGANTFHRLKKEA